MAKYYDCGRNRSPEYVVGDQVWLSLENYTSACPSKKLDDKWASVDMDIVHPLQMEDGCPLEPRIRRLHLISFS